MTAARRRFLLSCLLPFGIAAILGGLLLNGRRSRNVTIPAVPLGPKADHGPVHPQLAVTWGSGALLDSRGALWLWGSHFGFAATAPDFQIPWRVAPGTNWIRLSVGGNHLGLIRDDHTLWGAGYNFYGQLGTPAAGTMSVVQLSPRTNWTGVAAGITYTMALDSDGSLWAAGGSPVMAVPSPRGANAAAVAVGGLSSVAPRDRWKSISPGPRGAFAIRQDGTLWLLHDAGGRWESTAIETNRAWSSVVATLFAQAAPVGVIRADGALFHIPQPASSSVNGPALARALAPVPGSAGAIWKRVVPLGRGLMAERADGSWWGIGEQLPVLGPTRPGARYSQLRPLAWPDGVLAVDASPQTCVAFLSDGTLWYSGHRVGAPVERNNTPAHVVATILSGLGSAVGLPGANQDPYVGSPAPSLLWTWPGHAPAQGPRPKATPNMSDPTTP